MPLERQHRIITGHAFAVIRDFQKAPPAGLDVDCDARRTGVDGVLDQFLGDRSRAFDDFTGGDEIRNVVGKDADLVLWNNHPLSVFASASKTWVDGTLFFDRQRDLEIRESVQAERARIIQKMIAAKKGGENGDKPSRARPKYHCDDVDDEGNQLINWMAEIKRDSFAQNDWNRPGNLADFFPLYESWRFDWLDVAQMIRDADQILEYPMVDKDPIARWTFGRVTLSGDAAHPMYPRGSNGAAQAAIDARTLADFLRGQADPREALKAYEAARVEPAAKVVRTNREHPPDFINIKVEELVGDRPFEDLDKYITQDELRALSENYKRIAGFALADVKSG